MILLIENNIDCHYEIIETIIIKYNKILNQNIALSNVTIYLSIASNNNFKEYIHSKYPQVLFSIPKEFDYYISATIYDNNYDKLYKNSNKYFYISHEVTARLSNLSNVYFLTPLGNNYIFADKLPFIENKIKSNIPIYIIQGNITNRRRYYKLLEKILQQTYEHDFIIKLVGRGGLPQELIKYSSKIQLRNNLNFIGYHKEFLDAYCILPLITKKSHPQYYNNKLTSTINYCIGYNLKCLIDKDLQDIYNLKDVEIFYNENDIVDAFKKSLTDFYANLNILSNGK